MRKPIQLDDRPVSESSPLAPEVVAAVALVIARTTFLSMEETADRLRMSRSSIYDLVNAGDLPSRLVRHRRLISIADLDAFVNGGSHAAA
jgi:excisionase family DNA binding protein